MNIQERAERNRHIRTTIRSMRANHKKRLEEKIQEFVYEYKLSIRQIYRIVNGR